MAISTATAKELWGRSAARCNNPECRKGLVSTTDDGVSYLIGEMAHQIARNVGGPRNDGTAAPDTYGNLILLCPTCHTEIDKAPDGTFPLDLLRTWKLDHLAWIDTRLSPQIFNSPGELAMNIREILDENLALFENFGPHSKIAKTNPNSNLHALWTDAKLSKIIPNNTLIAKTLRANWQLLDRKGRSESQCFLAHQIAYEANQFGRLDQYPTFPPAFSAYIMDKSND